MPLTPDHSLRRPGHRGVKLCTNRDVLTEAHSLHALDPGTLRLTESTPPATSLLVKSSGRITRHSENAAMNATSFPIAGHLLGTCKSICA